MQIFKQIQTFWEMEKMGESRLHAEQIAVNSKATWVTTQAPSRTPLIFAYFILYESKHK